MKRYKKLAVFGGTFSPIHNGHLRALRAYAEAVRPDVLYVIPTAVPPHKMREDAATDAQRIAMLQFAVKDTDLPCEVVVSDMEMQRGGKSYTVDTVATLQQIADEVVIYCGTDMLLTLDKWREYERLLKMVSVAYMQREEDHRYAEQLAQKACYLTESCGARLIALSPFPQEISSSAVRAAVQNGEDISSYVPASVAQYIAKEGLYK